MERKETGKKEKKNPTSALAVHMRGKLKERGGGGEKSELAGKSSNHAKFRPGYARKGKKRII